MLKKKEKIVLYENKGNHKVVFGMFFSILAFLCVYLPFFGSNLRYSLGQGFEIILTTLGGYCITFGSISLGLGFASLFFSRSMRGVQMMILGGFLLVIGGWCAFPLMYGTIYSSAEAFFGYN